MKQIPLYLPKTRAPTRGAGGRHCPRAALLVKRRNSKWSCTNEPEVRFRFKFWLRLDLPYVPVLAWTVPV